MTRRFVIGVEGLGELENAHLKGYLDSHGTWWHWIQNFWLFTTEEPDITASDLRDYVTSINYQVRSIVLEVDQDVTWAGKGPRTERKNMFGWLHANWNLEKVED